MDANAVVLVLNAGSSSLKFSVYRAPDADAWQPVARGQIEGIGTSPRLYARQPIGLLAYSPIGLLAYWPVGLLASWRVGLLACYHRTSTPKRMMRPCRITDGRM